MRECKCYCCLNENYKLNNNLKIIGKNGLSLIIGNKEEIVKFLDDNDIKNYYFEIESKNPKYPLLDYSSLDVRVEYGAIIRDKAILKKGCIVLMNAVINVDASIGYNTMIDMGAIIGSSSCIGNNCHIGANAVIAGVLEPVSSSPVVIEDNCFIGANSVVLEGITIGKNSIVGALTLVNKNVPSNSLVIGTPCKILPLNDEVIKKCQINDELRS